MIMFVFPDPWHLALGLFCFPKEAKEHCIDTKEKHRSIQKKNQMEMHKRETTEKNKRESKEMYKRFLRRCYYDFFHGIKPPVICIGGDPFSEKTGYEGGPFGAGVYDPHCIHLF
ncbi:hypothetical protein [Anaerotignum sp.]